MKKIGRNDPCHCGSGKKFKKCCESTMIGGRFVAKPMTAPRVLTSLFQSHVAPSATQSLALKNITVMPPGAGMPKNPS